MSFPFWRITSGHADLVPISAILIAVLVLDTRFDPTPRSSLVLIASPVTLVVIAVHSPIAACCAMVLIIHHSSHIVLAHAIHVVAIAILCFPIPTDPNVLTALLVLNPRLIGLLRRPLRLHRGRLGLTRR
jgi:hypothetical protein